MIFLVLRARSVSSHYLQLGLEAGDLEALVVTHTLLGTEGSGRVECGEEEKGEDPLHGVPGDYSLL